MNDINSKSCGFTGRSGRIARLESCGKTSGNELLELGLDKILEGMRNALQHGWYMNAG